MQGDTIGCLFGGDEFDAVMADLSDTMTACNDPLAPYEFGDGGIDSFFGGETCEQCLARQHEICEHDYKACGLGAFGMAILAAIGCTAITAGLGLAVCGILVLGGETAVLQACQEKYNSCELSKIDRCPKCQT